MTETREIETPEARPKVDAKALKAVGSIVFGAQNRHQLAGRMAQTFDIKNQHNVTNWLEGKFDPPAEVVDYLIRRGDDAAENLDDALESLQKSMKAFRGAGE